MRKVFLLYEEDGDNHPFNFRVWLVPEGRSGEDDLDKLYANANWFITDETIETHFAELGYERLEVER